MKSKNSIKAEEWYEKAEHDLSTVQIIIDNSGHPDVAAVLLQQSVEKYLKGFLLSKGWKLVKTHDLKFLLDEASTYKKHVEPFYDLVIRLKGYYFEERYPVVGMNVKIEEVKKNFNEVKKLIKVIKSK